MSAGTGLTYRVAGAADRSAILELCRASLGWTASDPNEAFFAWKHDENAFGVSPMWVAETDEGRLAGVRVFLRWRFRTPSGEVLQAVRAVDTATHPDFQGRGIFTKLTLGALDDLDAPSRVDLVFNTPNDKSRPGYLKMGWQVVGRVPVAVRVRNPAALRRVLGTRAAASKWSEENDAGISIDEAFADERAVGSMLASLATRGISTDRSVGFLRWRYRFEPLHYRAMPLGSTLNGGVVVFRLRRRGAALEATICEVLGRDCGSVRTAVRQILRDTGADYAIRIGGPRTIGSGFLPAPRLGPLLTWRPLRRPAVPALSELDLALGDVELF